MFVACSVSFSRFLLHNFFSFSQISVFIFFLHYLLPYFHFLFVCFLVSLISTETITSQIPVPHCHLCLAQTFSCCIVISLVPDFMVFDQESVEVQLHN
jgi:hypothetical protein